MQADPSADTGDGEAAMARLMGYEHTDPAVACTWRIFQKFEFLNLSTHDDHPVVNTMTRLPGYLRLILSDRASLAHICRTKRTAATANRGVREGTIAACEM